jgi:hypothetical protein
VRTVSSKTRGRPRLLIDADWLAGVVSPAKGYSIKMIAKLCHVSTKTVRSQLREHRIDFGYSKISQNLLDHLCRLYKDRKPNSGYRYILGWLKSHNIKVTKQAVLDSLKRIDAVGQALRRYGTVVRQPYSVPRSNYLWHMDGHHKLIAWGIVLHGIIDGFCRTV